LTPPRQTGRQGPPIELLSAADGLLPPLLAEIPDAPDRIYVRGRLPDAPCVAIVGSRACTAYGRDVATALARDLAALGLTIVSGLARGIDAAAHRGALAAEGVTVAVLPNGIGRIYPAGHRMLARSILERGALIAETDSRDGPAKWHFPRRNRLIAGLSLAVIVVEAGERSGARITADLALGYDRELLVVPGNIDSPRSHGCNALLRDGARPCTGVDDVLDALPGPVTEALTGPPATLPVTESADGLDGRILRICRRDGEIALAEMVAETAAALPDVLAAISRLEARGLIVSRPGNKVAPRPGRGGPV
jgi:DNA processing protein